MKKKLAVILADGFQIPLVKKAKEMGIETHCFGWDKKEKHYVCKEFADYFYPMSVYDKEMILEKCKEIQIDGVLSILSSIAVPTVAYIAQNLNLPGNRYEDMLNAENKFKARQIYLKEGVSSPRFAVVRSGETPDIKDLKYPMIVKPTDCGGSYGVMKVNNDDELQIAIPRAQKASIAKEALIEEFVTGVEVSVDALSWNGKHYVFDVRDKETTGAPYFVEVAHHTPAQLNKESITKIENEARKALDALNFRYGPSDTEVIITEEGEVYIVEVNPRMGGDLTFELIKYSTGHDYMKLAINLALGYWEEPVIMPKYVAGIYFLSKECEWVGEIIKNKDKYPEIINSKLNKDELKEIQSSGDRSGYFTYISDRKRTMKDYIKN